jgi:hypothetical protein
MKRRVELTENYFRDYWLGKYHNTNCEEVVKKHPRLVKTSKWFAKYPCTTQQHDEWYDWAIKTIQKHYKCSKMQARKMFCFDYLNVAPNIIKDDK